MDPHLANDQIHSALKGAQEVPERKKVMSCFQGDEEVFVHVHLRSLVLNLLHSSISKDDSTILQHLRIDHMPLMV